MTISPQPEPAPVARLVPRVVGTDEEPEAEPPAVPGLRKRADLTDIQKSTLRAIMDLKSSGEPITFRAIADEADVPSSSIQHHVKSLIAKGYVEREGAGRGNIRWRVLRNPDGTPRAQATAGSDRALIDDAVKAGRVTKCPPAYAHGIGATEAERQFGARMPVKAWDDEKPKPDGAPAQ